MVIRKREDVTKQGFCKYSEENSFFGEVSHFFWGGGSGKGRGVGWGLALIWVWVGGGGGGVEVGANSKLGAYSNKYGIGSLWKKSDISRRHHWFLRAQTWISILMTVLPIANFNQSETLPMPDPGTVASSEEISALVPRLPKPAVASQNVSCFLS